METPYRLFTDGNVLFMPGMLLPLGDGTLENISFPLEILPLPKPDEN